MSRICTIIFAVTPCACSVLPQRSQSAPDPCLAPPALMEPSLQSAARLAPTSLHPPPCRASASAFASPLLLILQESRRAVTSPRIPRCSCRVPRALTSSTKRQCPRYKEAAQYSATALLISPRMLQCALCWANYTSTVDARSCSPCPSGTVSALGAAGAVNYSALPSLCTDFVSGCSELKTSEAQPLPSPPSAPDQGPSPTPQAPGEPRDEVRVGVHGRGQPCCCAIGLCPDVA